MVFVIIVAIVVMVPIVAYWFLTSASVEDFTNYLMEPAILVILLFIQDTIFVVIPYFIYFRSKVLTWAEMGLDQHNFGSRMMTGLLTGLGLGALMVLIVMAINYDTGGGLPGPELNSMTDLALLLVGGSIIAPIAEEFFFRGIAFKGVMKWMDHRGYKHGFLFALLFSSIIFAAIHNYDIFGSVVVFLAGMLFAYLFERTGSIIPGIFAHAAYNAVVITAEFFGHI